MNRFEGYDWISSLSAGFRPVFSLSNTTIPERATLLIVTNPMQMIEPLDCG
jgi:hypothetical protein